MGDYERSTTVEMAAEELFAYLSDVEHLPQYMDRMTQAHRTGDGDAVEVEAKLPPEATGAGKGPATAHGEAWFRVNGADHRLEWGSEGDHHYSGMLQVEPDGDTSSRVRVRLHTEHDDADAINSGLDATLRNIELIATTPGTPS